MEYTALLAGEPFSDAPGCVDGELAAVLRHANDRLSAADRPRLVPLLGRAIGLGVPPPAAGHPPRRPRRPRGVPAPPAAAPAVARLQRSVSRRLTAVLGQQLPPSAWASYAGGRDVDRLFWALMSEPWPVRTSAAYVDRLVDRLVLLHECYEQAVDELGLPRGTGADVPAGT
ncbi:hypothetical protein [Geodermatophilus marinus]|uniref:hypothetical protein n=1 Tax=Geodermatophilus sp. LHW52908 TaxID=2303986 RepID=UPI0011C1B16A|nr:hypothetical protein [Geodermatophilus sp. LHW52908]